ncbi:hypothetical protein TELCIR_14438 [Teladorsagia circumcincta]|uniref:Uncharacterized protein n=1 Tax=Teladorsagia circumcincta TaxID=45464 RepID=A0A2G9U145_TELCI|nr:hypothetical protein TELCIR_14438 [Teladorsagia circumcincta]
MAMPNGMVVPMGPMGRRNKRSSSTGRIYSWTTDNLECEDEFFCVDQLQLFDPHPPLPKILGRDEAEDGKPIVIRGLSPNSSQRSSLWDPLGFTGGFLPNKMQRTLLSIF